MSLVEEIPELEAALKNGKTNHIKTLHKLIFGNQGDRLNRKRIREFTGFPFKIDTEEFKQKLASVVNDFSVNDLITIANVLCIDNTGSTEELATRIISSLCDFNILRNNIIEENSEIESEIENESDTSLKSVPIESSVINKNDHSNLRNGSGSKKNKQKQLLIQENVCKPVINFNDIENIIVPYDGSQFQNIETWIENFEDVASMFQLSDLYKLVFSKRCMTGKAKLFVMSETKVNSWDKLKSLLINEFGSVCTSAELHDLLSKRKMKENESLDEYFLVMKQLCSRGNIDDSSLIQYVINGINDSMNKKSFLYGCQSLIEFKNKLKVYEKLREDYGNVRLGHDNDRRGVSKPKVEIKQSKPVKSNINCFNCGGYNHKSVNCFNKSKGPRCFNCADFGHKSFQCTKPKQSRPGNGQPQVNTVISQNLILKEVRLCSLSLMSLMDTGSQKTLLKQSVYDRLADEVKLEPTNISLTGLGNLSIRPKGHFKTEIEIENSKFQADICVVSDNSIGFDLIVGIDVIRQGTLTIAGNEVKLCQNNEEPHNFLVNVARVLDESQIDLSHITDKKLRLELSSLIENYVPVKTKTVDVKMKIILTDEIPVCSSPRRLPLSEKKIVEAQVNDWLDQGIIRRSFSDFSAPVVLVKKKDNTMRLCIDFRRLNKKTVREHFPLPVIDDVIDQLHSAELFTTIDLKNGFFHVDVEESSRKYTSFVTHEGQYEFLKCPFGLTNSPSVFQKYIYNVFRELLKDNTVVIYMDDLIIPSRDEAEGLKKLQRVLQTASEYGLELNLKKCNFLKREIDFLGHRISNGKLYPSPLKTKAVINFPEPKCTKDVQSYLGLTGYFRKFIKNYSVIAKPLSDLLRKDVKFRFDDKENKAFTELKQLLASEPVLSIYNPKSETEIHCDASIDGYGSVLVQKSMVDNQFHPVYFASKKTTETERKYSSYELEVLAVIKALEKFRIYVLGIPFKIVTDCNAFKMTMDKKEMCTKIARWALMLSDFDYTIEHRRGSSMRHVDALSRNPICMVIHDSVTQKIIQAQETDEHIKTLKEILKEKPYDDYLIKNNVLYKCINGNDLLVVPEEMQANIIKTIHEKGHFAAKKIEERLKNEFYIPKMKCKIDKCISNCIPCILVNRKGGRQEGLLHPIEKEETPLHTYHIDHLGPLQSTHKNYRHVFAVIDAFTKFVWLYPTKSTDTAEVIAKLEIQKAVFGSPSRIISDKGPAFTSKPFEDYCAEENIQHIQITTGLPRANGQVERLNSVIISILSKLSIENPMKWYKHVTSVQQAINSTFQRSINTTPFELLFGTKMKLKNNVIITNLLTAEIQSNFISNRDELRKEAKKQILKVQTENCKTYNLRRRKANAFHLNDVVAIKRTQQGPGLKLKPKYLGPYLVTKVKSNDTYDVRKIGFSEGPMVTSTCAEYMKPWPDET